MKKKIYINDENVVVSTMNWPEEKPTDDDGIVVDTLPNGIECGETATTTWKYNETTGQVERQG